ncbi:MAG: SLC13 family permease [Acidihalobacter sp.]
MSTEPLSNAESGGRWLPAHIELPVKHILVLIAIAVVCALLVWPPIDGQTFKAAVVILFAIGLWATGWLPEWLTAFVFFTFCMVAGIAPASDVLSGFTSDATWLVLSGVVISAAIRHTGLEDRLAERLAPMIEGSSVRTILGVVLFGVGMMFVMPSAMGRVVLMLPILQALADRLGYAEGSKGQLGILMAGVFGTYLPAFAVLPANVPNNVFVGTVQTVLGKTPTYDGYLLLHFPVLGLVKTLFLIALLILLYRDRPTQKRHEESLERRPVTRSERHLTLLLLAAVVMWATDSWLGISAAWVGMLVALVCLFPGSGLLAPKPFRSLGFEPVFYVAGIVSMGVVADHSGLGTLIAKWVLDALPLSTTAPTHTFGLLSALSALIGLVVTLPAVPAIMTPMITSLSHATGWLPQTVAMTQVIGFSTVLLPYQAPPLIVAVQTSALTYRQVVRMCLMTAVITIVLLWPLDYLWWWVLGLIR